MLSAIKWRDYLPRRTAPVLYVLAALGFTSLITAIIISCISLVGRPRTLTVINAEVESLEFSVSNPDQAAIDVENMRLIGDVAGVTGCFSGRLEPALSSTVSYSGRHNEPLLITIETVTGLDGRGLASAAHDVQLVADCPGVEAVRLPVFGPGSLGDRLSQRADGWSYVLLSGSLNVYGRTLSIPLPGFRAGGALYPAFEQPVVLPAASRVETRSGIAGRGSADRAMIGFAEWRPDQPLQVAVSTAADEISILPPGAAAQPMRIEIGIFAQIFSDPNILRLQAYLLIFILLLPIVLDTIALALAGSDQRSRREAGRTADRQDPETRAEEHRSDTG